MSYNIKINIKKSSAHIFNGISFSYLVIAFNFLQLHAQSLVLAILQSIIALITIGMSGNFRLLLLHNKKQFKEFFLFRSLIALLVLPFLIQFSFFYLRDYFILASILVIRKIIDWIDETVLIGNYNSEINKKYICTQVFFLLLLPLIVRDYNSYILIYLTSWILTTSIIIYPEFIRKLSNINLLNSNLIKQQYFFMISATFLPCLTNLLFRYKISNLFSNVHASEIISSFALGGGLSQVFIYAFLPSLIASLENKSQFKKLLKSHFFLGGIFIFLITVASFIYKVNLKSHNFDYRVIIISCITGFFLLYVNIIKQYLIKLFRQTTFEYELLINLIFFLALIFHPARNIFSYFTLLPLYLSIFSAAFYTLIFRIHTKSKNLFLVFSLFLISFLLLIFYPKFSISLILSDQYIAQFNYVLLLFAFFCFLLMINIDKYEHKFYFLIFNVSCFIYLIICRLSELEFQHYNFYILGFCSILLLFIYLFKEVSNYLNIKFLFTPFNFIIILLIFIKFT